MEKPTSVLLTALLVFFFNLCSGEGYDSMAPPKIDDVAAGTWCVAKPSAEETALMENIQYSCSFVNCGVLQPPGGQCSLPDLLTFHASVAMNLFYQANGRKDWTCYFNNTGLVSTTDPSIGNCSFPLA